VSASCEYSGPLRFEDVVELHLRITRIGARSLSYEVDFMKDGQRVATGKLTSVCVAVEGGEFRPTAIPPAIRRKLEGPG
jgi:4-hydroxybenzoyl-CoA thioesterase/acyl-CoA thioester hydrolase